MLRSDKLLSVDNSRKSSAHVQISLLRSSLENNIFTAVLFENLNGNNVGFEDICKPKSNDYRTHKTSFACIVRNSIGICFCLLDTILNI